MVQTRDFEQSEVQNFAASSYVQLKLADLCGQWSRAGAALPVAVVVSIVDDILATQPSMFTGNIPADLRLSDVLLDSYGQVHLISQKSLSHEALVSLLYRLLCGGVGEEAIPSSARMFLAQLDDRAHFGMRLDPDVVRAELRQALGSPAERFEVGNCVRFAQNAQPAQPPVPSFSPWSNVVASASDIPSASMPYESFGIAANVDLDSLAAYTGPEEAEYSSNSVLDASASQESPTEDLPNLGLDALEPEPQVVIDSQIDHSQIEQLSEPDEAFAYEVSETSDENNIEQQSADEELTSDEALSAYASDESSTLDHDDEENFGSDDDFVPQVFEGANTMIEVAHDPGLPPPPPPASLMPKIKIDGPEESELQTHQADEEELEVPELVVEHNDSENICVTNYPEPDYYVEQSSEEGPPSLLPRVRDGVHTRPGYREVTREKSQPEESSQLPRVRIIPTKRRPLTLPAAPPARLRTTSTGPADSMISLPRKDSPTLWAALICVSIVLGAAIYSILGS
ncbi:MAG: hypothetical protein VYC39_14520 [Myxococcota bacterium]|nr:hypothetical protein [Myxococcota bacterium]